MQIQERIQRAEEIINQYQDLLGSDINTLRSEAQVHEIVDIDKTLTNLRDEGRLLQIGIIGRVKAGKSSLLNALFFDGASVLPHAATPMTAALTTLSYGERPTMRAEFFTVEDLDIFRRLHDEHTKAIDSKVQEIGKVRINSPAVQRSGAKAGVTVPPMAAQKVTEFAKKQADKDDPVKAAAWEIWQSIETAGGTDQIPKEELLECKGLEDLRGRLAEYVGAKGRWTAFTKCLHLELPFERLRDLRVVDTPGLNDPIVSREHRTQLMLKDCDAVFIVSPAGQFISQQDEALMQRLTSREGIRSLYFVASQFDTQLFGHEYQSLNGNLPRVIENQQKSLANHVQNISSSWAKSNDALAAIVGKQESEVRISSSAAHALWKLDSKQWDETATFTHDQLNNKYADYFTDQSTKAHWLETLSGISRLENDLDDVRGNKRQIFEKRVGDYIAGQNNASQAWVVSLLRRAEERKTIFETSDLASVEAKITALNRVTQKGIEATDDVFSDEIKVRALDAKSEINGIIKDNFKEASSESENAKGTSTEIRDKKGAGAWCARKLWGGGKEEVTVETIDSRKVREAINNFRDVVQDDLHLHIERNNIRWRNEISKSIISRLRDTIGDDEVNSDDIRRIIKSVLIGISDLPEPKLPELPEKLSATGRLRGWQADEFRDEAEKYINFLENAGRKFANEVQSKLKSLQALSVGSEIFNGLRKEIESLSQQLQNKRLTAEKYQELLRALSEVAK